MSGLSDKDQKLILILLTAMIIILPYTFFIKDKRVETAGIKTEITSLNERLVYLNELNANRETFEKETKQMNEDRDKIINSFPADVRQENYVMFLYDTQYSSNKIMDAETGIEVYEYPILFNVCTFGENIETPISSEDADTGLTGFTNSSVVDYGCYYGGVKYLLKYLMDYKDPMIYRRITMEYDTETGVITGQINLDQYAIDGNDRKLAPADIHPTVKRGNEEVGVFGPLSKVFEEQEEVVTTAEETDVEAQEE